MYISQRLVAPFLSFQFHMIHVVKTSHRKKKKKKKACISNLQKMKGAKKKKKHVKALS